MLTTNEIAKFIAEDRASVKKRMAKTGLDYYEGNHDIKSYKICFIDSDGKLKEDKTKSNIRISHPFFTELVDQLVQYMLSGKESFVKSDDPDLQAQLDEYFNNNEDFVAEISEMLAGVQAKGFDYMFAYRGEDGKTKFQWADSLCVCECEAKYTSDHKKYIIYWYEDRVDLNGNKIINVRVYDENQVYFYTRVNDGEIVVDDTIKPNPQPHSIYRIGEDGESCGASYGRIPFFRFDNGKKQISSLKPVKDMIDDYDLMNAGLSNNIQDTNEALYVVRGFNGDNLDELMTNIRAKKHIGVDEEGGVDIKTVDIPVEARKAKMEVDEKNIYRFGFGLNIAGLKDTAATTNLAIQAAYSLLDLRANKMEKRLKQFMRKLLNVVLEEINEENGTDYQQKDIYFDFEREIPTNAQENAQIELLEAQRRQTEINTVLNLAGTIDDETKIQLICEQLDIDYNEIKGKLPNPDETSPYNAETELNAVTPDGGDGIE